MTDVVAKHLAKGIPRMQEKECELSEEAKAEIATARRTPRAKYLSLDKVKKQILG